MRYTDLIKARRKTGDLPTLPKKALSTQQAQWDKDGRCIECGQSPQLPDSRICRTCRSQLSLEEIQQDIEAIRRKILNGSKNK